MKKVGLALIILSVILGGAYFFKKYSSQAANGKLPKPKIEVSLPWIEVIKGEIREVKSSDKKPIRELKTGDEIEPGTEIEVRENSFAHLHFPDGSVLRADGNTHFILTEATFDKRDEKLGVEIKLLAGRLWSKVVALLTPDSHWEIRTSNAVVNVRGTAFGMAYEDGRSTIIGSENKVAVKSGAEEITVTENTAVLVEKGSIRKLDDLESLLKENWIKISRLSDDELQKKIDALRVKGLRDKSLRDELRKLTLEEFVDAIIERREENSLGK